MGPQSGVTVKVNVDAADSKDAPTAIKTIEPSRADFDKTLFEEILLDMRELSDAVLGELEAQLQSQINEMTAAGLYSPSSANNNNAQVGGFIQVIDLPHQANVQIVPSDLHYPTVESAVEDMEHRQRAVQDLVVAKTNIMKLELLKSIVGLSKEALSS